MKKLLFLVGYMGAGKSSVGQPLARLLDWDFIDLDQEIERVSGLSPADWISQKGELAFRKKEREVLENLLNQEQLVVATGGGTPCYFDNMQRMMASGLCIYLEANPKFLSDRLLSAKTQRPLIAHLSAEELPEFIAKHLFERRAFYLKAQMKFNAASANPAQWLAEIQAFFADYDK